MRVLLLLTMRALWRIPWAATGRCRRLTVRSVALWPAAAEKLLLAAQMLVLCLQRGATDLHKSILNGTDGLESENGPWVNRSGDRLLPGLEHLVHLTARSIID